MRENQPDAAKAALDMAILDWAAKRLNAPVWKLLGLDGRKTVQTTYSIGIDEVPVMQDKVREAAGFSVYKIKVGTADGGTDVSQVIAAIDWVVQHKADNGMNIRVRII